MATGVRRLVAAESGEAFRTAAVGAGVGGETLTSSTSNAEAGDLARTVCLAFAAIALVAVLWLLRPGRGGVIGLLVAAILVIASVAVTATVLIAGHKGSTAVWSQTISGRIQPRRRIGRNDEPVHELGEHHLAQQRFDRANSYLARSLTG